MFEDYLVALEAYFVPNDQEGVLAFEIFVEDEEIETGATLSDAPADQTGSSEIGI